VAAAAERLAARVGLLQDPQFVREFLRAVRKDRPVAALPVLLQIKPRSSSLTRRMAVVLALDRGTLPPGGGAGARERRIVDGGGRAP
jgi:hypothetical protein